MAPEPNDVMIQTIAATGCIFVPLVVFTRYQMLMIRSLCVTNLLQRISHPDFAVRDLFCEFWIGFCDSIGAALCHSAYASHCSAIGRCNWRSVQLITPPCMLIRSKVRSFSPVLRTRYDSGLLDCVRCPPRQA